MTAKGWHQDAHVHRLTYDFAVHGGAVGTIALGNLPDNFIIDKVIAHVETALVGGGTFVLGEDGGGNASGYFLDMDALAAGAVYVGTGALVFTSPLTAAEIGNDKPYLVAAAKDGVQVTIATTAYTAGKISFYFSGCQGA